jgi:HK97 family phage prohead protease
MKIKISAQNRLASFRPETLDVGSRTIDVVFSTGAAVTRYDFWKDERYVEELEISDSAVDLSRFNNGAPVLNSHRTNDLSDQIGVIENARIEDGLGVATLRLSNRESVKEIVQDIQDGIIRNLSVGYRINKLKEMERNSDDIRVYRAIDWTPHELSFVTVPADAQSQVRSEEEAEKNDCEVEEISKEETAVEETAVEETAVEETAAKEPTTDPDEGVSEETIEPQSEERNMDELKKAQEEAVAAERKRCAGIKNAVKAAKLGDDFAERMIEEGTDINEVRALILDELARKDQETATATKKVEVGEDNTRKYAKEGIEKAILARAGHSVDHDENSNKYRNLTLIQQAKLSLKAAGNRDVDFMNNHTVIENAMKQRGGAHSSSDFPLILANVMNKSIQKGYQEAPRTWEPLASSRTVSDFKEVSKVHLGEFSQLEEVKEGGEYKHGKLSERNETYKISKYGKMIPVTWEMLVNDDLSAFASVPMKMGKKARDLESDIVWNLIINNTQVMKETGNVLFHASHNNLNQGGAGAVSETTLAAMRESMRLHKDLDGTSPINIFPRYLFVPAAREVEAAKILAPITPETSSNVNPFADSFRVSQIVEPRLDVANKPWLIAADSSQVDMIEVARLAGYEAPTVTSREGFEIDGMEYKIRHLFVAHALDYRGLSLNAGV